MLSAFAAIGQKKRANLSRWIGTLSLVRQACARSGHREYNGRTYNEIKSMLYPEDVDFAKY